LSLGLSNDALANQPIFARALSSWHYFRSKIDNRFSEMMLSLMRFQRTVSALPENDMLKKTGCVRAPLR